LFPAKSAFFLDYLKDKFKTGPPEDAWFIILYFRIVEGWVEVQNQHNRLGSTQASLASFSVAGCSTEAADMIWFGGWGLL
jgi:hypothetical protein